MWRRFLCLMAVVLLTGAALAVEAKSSLPEDCIYINLASRELSLYKKGQRVFEAPIGIGKPATPSPCGTFKILDMHENPVWIDPEDPKKIVESGWGNPLGLRWMQFWGNYGIHGTNNPDSIGGYVSNGCIRMYEEDVEELYEQVDVGCNVILVYERIVFEKQADGTYGYRIYPDGYNARELTVKDVQAALQKQGLQATVTAKEIAEKLAESDGSLTILRHAYKVEIDGRWISGRAVEFNGGLYLPVMPVSNARKIPYSWVRATEELTTEKGSDFAISLNDELLMTPECAAKLFGVTGGLNDKAVYCLMTDKYRAEQEAKAAAEAEAKAREAAMAQEQAYGTLTPVENDLETAKPTPSEAAVQKGKG